MRSLRSPSPSRSAPLGLPGVLAVLIALFLLSGPVLAGVLVENAMRGEARDLGEGLVLLDYQSGTHLTVSGTADWDDGTYLGTRRDNDGVLRLDHRGDVPATASPAWWNTEWGLRQCVTVDNPGAAQTEHPVEVRIDTADLIADGNLLATGADLRAIDSTTGLELPLWIEDALPSSATTVWIQLANVPNGSSEFCFYLGNSTATTVSDQLGVFTYSTHRARYYTGNRAWNGATLSLVSLIDNNSVIVGGAAPVIMNRGQVRTFSVTQNTIIEAFGPMAGASTSDGTDSIVPESFAATSYVFAVNRNQQQIWVRAPFGTTTIEFLVGGVPVATNRLGTGDAPSLTHTVTTADGVVGFAADASDGQAVMVRSTTGTHFIASHVADTGSDGLIGVPWRSEPLFGVRSVNMLVGGGPTTVNYTGLSSDGSTINQPVGPTALITHAGGGPRGSQPGMRVTGDAQFAASQYADSTGNEATSYYPTSLLETQYFVPLTTNYISIVCPTPGQTVTITRPSSAPTNVVCTNPGGLAGAPGHAYSGLTASGFPAGTLIESTAPFYAIAERGTDEFNVVGPKAARPRPILDPATAQGALEGLYVAAGTWESPVYDTGSSGIYGLLSALASVPAGTTFSVQMATGPTAGDALAAPLAGPDGTAGTSYGSGAEVVSSVHDFDQFVRLVVTLGSTDLFLSPSLTSLDLVTELTQFNTDAEARTLINIAADPGVDTHLLARVHGTGSLSYTARISYRDGTGLPAANLLRVRTDHPADHVQAVAGAIVQGQGSAFALTPGSSFSLLVDEDVAAGNVVTVDVTLEAADGGGAVIEHDIRFVLTAP